MMHRVFAASAVALLCAAPLGAQATERSGQGNEMALTGTVIDLNCKVANGVAGESHKSCATACAKAGVQLAILGSDGTIYVLVSGKAADPTNPRLLPHVESPVKVTGTHRLINGLHTIEIKTVTAAS
jgi:hypothetical protein